MKPDDLAAAAKLWEENRGETIVVLETHRAVLRAAATLANAYLAREAAIATCEQTCDAATTDRITRMIAGQALFDVYPPPNDLDQRWREQWSQARYLEDLEDFAETQIAREAELAKLITREWLVSVLGEPQTNYDHHARWAHKVEEGEFVIYEFEGEAWCFIPCEDSLSDGSRTGEEVVRFLPDRGDVRAFLRLADWPINENGGE